MKSFLTIFVMAFIFASCEQQEDKPKTNAYIVSGRNIAKPEIKKLNPVGARVSKTLINKPVTGQFLIVGDSTYSLKNANLYLTRDILLNWDINSRPYRNYMISDGTYTGANGTYGWNYSDYSGATYLIAIEIALPYGIFETGDYPMVYTFDATENNSWLWMPLKSTDYWNPLNFALVETSDFEIGSNPIRFTGSGMDDGDFVRLRFDGTLAYTYWDGMQWVGTYQASSLDFKSTIVQTF